MNTLSVTFLFLIVYFGISLYLVKDIALRAKDLAVCGILALFLVPAWQPVHWGQLFAEHLVCFSGLGYAGCFGNDKKWKVLCGILLASIIKFCGHTLSGVLFFSRNAWDGWGAWGYSLAYNFSQNIPLCLLSGAIILVLPLGSLKYLPCRKKVSRCSFEQRPDQYMP